MIQNTLHFVLSSTRLAAYGDVKLAFFARWVAGCRNGHYFSSLTWISYPLRWCLKASLSTAARQMIGIMRHRRNNKHIYALAHVFAQSLAGHYTLIEGENILSAPLLTIKCRLGALYGCESVQGYWKHNTPLTGQQFEFKTQRHWRVKKNLKCAIHTKYSSELDVVNLNASNCSEQSWQKR